MKKRKPHRPSWADELPAKTIREMLAETFAFLHRDHGYRKPRKVDPAGGVIAWIFYAQRVAIQPVVDLRPAHFTTHIIRLERGKEPQGWQLDRNGRQFMIRLFELARRRGHPRLSPETVPQDPRDALQQLLDAEVATLRSVAPEVLDDDDALFDRLNQENEVRRAALTRKRFFEEAERLYRDGNFGNLLRHLDAGGQALDKVWTARRDYALKKREQ